MKKLIVAAVAVGVVTCGFAENPADYRSWILANGGTPVSAGGTSGTAYHASYPPEFAFDGDVSADTTERYLGELKDGACLIFGADMGDKAFTMSAYRICQLTAGDYANDRAPTAWTLYGGDTSEGPWTEIETRSGVTWSGELGQKKTVPAIDDCWRFFRLSAAQSYKFYKIACTASRAATTVIWNVGVMEVEFLSDVCVTFVPPHAEANALVNSLGGAITTYDETDYPVDAEHALSFTGFEAVGMASTVFLGGLWDFGATASDDVTENFFKKSDTAGGRTTTLDSGAVVTNVGALYLAGTKGDNNTLLLKGQSELHANRFVLGMKNGSGQKSRAFVTDGSLLHCRGWIDFSDLGLSASKDLTGSELVVSNAGSRLVVDGTTYLDRTRDSYKSGVGGNTLTITDHATAKLHALNLSTSCLHSMSNRVIVSKGAYLETTAINLGTEWASGNNTYDYARFEVLDGGVVTNTGTLSIGYQDGSKHGRISLVVSNGVFYSEKKLATANAMIKIQDSEIIVSGPKAVFRNGTYDYTVRLFGPGAVGSRFIVENGAVLKSLPVAYGYTYMGNTTRGQVIVRDRGVLSVGDIRMASYNHSGTAIGSTFIAGSGASVTADQFWCDALHGTVTVDNAVLYCKNTHYYNAYGALNIGAGLASGSYQKGTNCVLNIVGHTPKVITPGNKILIDRASKVVFHLPSDGYPAAAQPLMDSRGYATNFGDDCAIEFTGAEELLAYHRDVLRRKGRYTLIQGGSFVLPDALLAAANASLPEGLSIAVEDGKNASGTACKNLVLKVSPQFGLLMIVR